MIAHSSVRVRGHRVAAIRRTTLGIVVAAFVAAGIQPAGAATTPSTVGLVSFTAASYSRSTGLASLTIDWPDTRNAVSYQIFMSRSYTMSSATVFTSTSSTKRITGLARGKDYFFQVRGVNQGTVGTKSSRVGHTTILSQGLDAGGIYSVMTFNVCSRACSSWDGIRDAAAVERITTYEPDVVAAQEADNLTTVPTTSYTQALYKSGKRLLYKTSRFTTARWPAGTVAPSSPSTVCYDATKRVGCVYLGYHGDGNRWAVWTELIDKTNGKRVIFVDVHTVSGDTEARALDRKEEIATLISAMTKINPSHLPVVYAGDFNSHKNRSNDYLAGVFHTAGYYDAYDLSMSLKRQHYNSYNNFEVVAKTSLKWGDHVDHVWAVPSKTRVLSWANVAKYSGIYYVTPMPSDHNPILVTVQVN